MEYRQDLHDIIEPAVNSVGYELFACEYISAGENSVLRIYIDSPDGIGLDDCVRASHQVSAVLDVEDPIKGHYHLEVSSPGIDRALLKKSNFERYVGQMIKIKLVAPIEKLRAFKGILKSVQEMNIELDIGTQHLTIPFSGISKANLVEEVLM
jgi:ribosome maturation factor RimP